MTDIRNLSISVKEFRDRFSFILLCVYVFVAPLGTLFRFSSKETALGVSSVILLSLIGLYFIDSLYVFLRRKIFVILLLLILWLLLSSFFILDDTTRAYTNLIFLTGYILFCIAITLIHISLFRLRLLFFFLFLGIFLSAGLTLIDFLGIIDIPYVNMLKISTKVNGEEIYQASGFFMRRSAMAAYFSLVLPASFIIFLNLRHNFLRIILISTYFMGLLVLILTHNLAGITAILISCIIYFLFGYNGNFLLKLRNILILSGLILSFAFVLVFRFPQVIDVYMFRIQVHYSNAPVNDVFLAKQKESDNERLYFLKHAIMNVVKCPLGHGLSYISTYEYGLTDPHNIITQLIWGLGIFSFFWFALFVAVLINILKTSKNLKDTYRFYFDSIKYGLFSWLICAMAHNIIFTGLAWLFFGLMINFHYRYLWCNTDF